MRRLERGASYVPLIIVVVLLIVAIVWAYIKHDEVDKMTKQLKAAEDAATEATDKYTETIGYINQLADVVGFPLTEPGEGKQMAYKIDKDKIRAFLDERLDNLKTLTREFPEGIYNFDNADGGTIDKTEGGMIRVRYIESGSIPSESDLERLYGLIFSAENKMLVDIKGMWTALRDAKAEHKSLVEGKDKTIGEKDTEIQRITNERNSLQASLIQKESDLKAEISGLEDQKKAIEVDLENARKDARDQLTALNNQIAALKQDIVKLNKRKKFVEEPIGPDGTILAVSEGQGIAVIDRGKADHLQAGTTFDVYALGKGAQKVYKGVITVLDVDADTAKVRIVSTNNMMNPIVEGDYIESVTYNPKEQLNFVLLGRFKKYGRSDAAKRLEQLGQNVQNSVDIMTNYLVLGAPQGEDENLEDTDDYRRAKELGIRIITEKQLSTFLLY